jgi:hypothetical protein
MHPCKTNYLFQPEAGIIILFRLPILVKSPEPIR